MPLSRMCKLLGISRQNYYQYWQRAECVSIEESLVIDEVKRLRRTHPILGTKKLYILLTPFLLEHQIKKSELEIKISEFSSGGACTQEYLTG